MRVKITIKGKYVNSYVLEGKVQEVFGFAYQAGGEADLIEEVSNVANEAAQGKRVYTVISELIEYEA